jgi:uncharacterized membrane protein
MAAAFLLFYHTGFGRGLAVFASPADIFSVSLTDVALGYLAGLVGCAIGWLLFRPDKPITHGSASSSQTRVLSNLLYAIYFVLGVSAAIGVAVYIKTSTIITSQFTPALCFLVGKYTAAAGGKLGMSSARSTVLTIFFLMIILVSANGLSSGQSDRMSSYSE